LQDQFKKKQTEKTVNFSLKLLSEILYASRCLQWLISILSLLSGSLLKAGTFKTL